MNLSIGDGIAIASAAYLLRHAFNAWGRNKAAKAVASAITKAVEGFVASQKQ